MPTYTSPLKSSRTIAQIGNAAREKNENAKSNQPTNTNYTESAAKLRLSSQAQSSLERSSYLSNDPNALSGFDGTHAQELSQLQESFNANVNSSNFAEINVGAKDKGDTTKPFTIGSAALSALQSAPLGQLSPVKTANTPDSPGKQGLEKALSNETAIASRADAPKKLEDVEKTNPADLSTVDATAAGQAKTERVDRDAISSGSDIASPKLALSPGRSALEKALAKDSALTDDSQRKSATLESQAKGGLSDLSSVQFIAGEKQLEVIDESTIGVKSAVAAARSPISPGRQGLEKALSSESAIASDDEISPKTLESKVQSSASDLSKVRFVSGEQTTETINENVIGTNAGVETAPTPVSPGRMGLEEALTKDTTLTSSENAAPTTLEDTSNADASDLSSVKFIAGEKELESFDKSTVSADSSVATTPAPISPGRQGLEAALQQDSTLSAAQNTNPATLEDVEKGGASDLSGVNFVAGEVETETINAEAIGITAGVKTTSSPISPGRQGLQKALEQDQAIASSGPNSTLQGEPKAVESSLQNVDFTVAEETATKKLNQDAIGVHAAVEAVKTPESPGQQGLKEALEQPDSIESKNEVGEKIGKDALDATIEV